MVTLGQRIAELRTEKGYSSAKLAQELGYPRNAVEKFEAGRQTPSKAQQEQIASFFGVSLLYVQGLTNDRTRQSNWMDEISDEPVEQTPAKSSAVRRPSAEKKSDKKKKEEPPEGGVLDALLVTPAVRQLLKDVVLETLRSPEGQEAVRRALKGGTNRQL